MYIEFDQFYKIGKSKITKEMCQVIIENRSIEVHVNNGKGIHYNLTFDLYKAVDVEASSWRFSAGKRISVTFQKVDKDIKWWSVRKAQGRDDWSKFKFKIYLF